MMQVEKEAAAAWPSRPGASAVTLAQMIAAHVYDVALTDLLAPGRGDTHTAEARQVAMYLIHVVLGLKFSQIATHFGRERSTVGHACRHIEDLRDDPASDRLLAWMEALLRQAAGLRKDGLTP